MIPVDLTNLADYARRKLTDEVFAEACYERARRCLFEARRTLTEALFEDEADRALGLRWFAFLMFTSAHDYRHFARNARRRARR